MKKFKELTDKDTLYYLNPLNGEVAGFKVKNISGVKDERAKNHDTLKNWVRIEVFSQVLALHSPNIELIPTHVFLFDGRSSMQMAVVGTQLTAEDKFKVPTMFSPSKQTLETWMKTTK